MIRVLVVDDSALLRKLLGRLFASESRVTEASIRGFWKVYREAMGFSIEESK